MILFLLYFDETVNSGTNHHSPKVLQKVKIFDHCKKLRHETSLVVPNDCYGNSFSGSL